MRSMPAGFFLPMSKSKFTDEERKLFLEGVKKVGTISAGAREAGVKRRTARSWIERDPEFKERYEEALAEFKDSIEERLMSRIEEGSNGPTLRFKAKGELPEKYGPRPPRAEQVPERKGPTWEDLEEGAKESKDG